MITSDINTSTDKILNNPWRGAEAWHFYLLAQRQLYQAEYKYALKTALKLYEFEMELDVKKIYTIVAIAGKISGINESLLQQKLQGMLESVCEA